MSVVLFISSAASVDGYIPDGDDGIDRLFTDRDTGTTTQNLRA